MIRKNETAVISGASSGIGAAIAQKFSREGYDILLLGRDENKLSAVKAKCIGAKALHLAFDLKTISEHSSSLLNCLKELSPVSVLVNNAGVFHREAFIETSIEIWTEQFQVNLLSAVQLTQIIWPLFLKHKSGSIINIASTLGIKPAPQTSAYSAIKAALINWTLSLAQEGGGNNIRANCICPGIVDTPIHDFYRLGKEEKVKATAGLLDLQLLKSLGTPEDISEAAYFLGSAFSRWTTGSILHIDGGINIK